MLIVPNLFFYRPLKVSQFCADKLYTLYEKAQSFALENRFAKSILGRVLICNVAEVIGATVGGLASKMVLGTVMREFSRYYFPIGAAAAIGGLYHVQKKAAQAALAVLGISMAVTYFHFAFTMYEISQFTAMGGLFLGEWAGRMIGSTLGGYLALKAVRSNVTFWDPIESECYLVGMAKFHTFGEIFDSVIVRSTIPYISLPVNLIRDGVKSIGKSIAYNSNAVLSFIKALFREKRITQEVVIPLIKKVCSRYCETNSVPITRKLIDSVSQALNVLPSIEQYLRFLLRQPLFFDALKDKIESLSTKSDVFMTILMRAFHEYVDLFQKSKPLQEAYQKYIQDPAANIKAFKDALKQAIPGSAKVSPLFDMAAKKGIDELSVTIIKNIQQVENELTGSALTKETSHLKETLRIHLKYFFIYTLLNYNSNAMSSEEEKDSILDLNSLIFSIYNKPLKSHQITRSIGKMIQSTIKAGFAFKKWIYPFIEQPEERSLIYTQIQIDPDFHKKPIAPKKPRDVDKKLKTDYDFCSTSEN